MMKCNQIAKIVLDDGENRRGIKVTLDCLQMIRFNLHYVVELVNRVVEISTP
jgi:hypothetical protein